MMDSVEFLSWAARHSYPQLVLGKGDVIKHGELAWRTFAKKAGKRRQNKARRRIERWNALEQKQTA